MFASVFIFQPFIAFVDKKTFMKTKEAAPFLDIIHKLISHKPAIVTTPNSPVFRSKEIGAQLLLFRCADLFPTEKILERCIHPANKLSLRLEAFDLLLYILSLKPTVPAHPTTLSAPELRFEGSGDLPSPLRARGRVRPLPHLGRLEGAP